MPEDYIPITNLRGPAARITQVTAAPIPAGAGTKVTMTGPDQNRQLHFDIERGLPGVNAIENDEAMAAHVAAVDSETNAAVVAVIATQASMVDARLFPTPQEAIDAAPAGSTVWFDPRTTWNLSTDLVVNKPLTIRGDDTLMTQTGVGKAGFTVTSSDTHFDGLHLVGRQSGVLNSGERAINFVGAAAGTRLARTSVRNTRIRRWGYAGVMAKFVSRFTWDQVTVEDVCYAGMGIVTGEAGKVTNSSVETVTQGTGASNSYGVFASHDESVSQEISPRSANIEFNNVRVSNVPAWEGFDTHAGINISFINCQAYNCKFGFALVPGRAGGANYVLAPKGGIVQGCTADSGRTDGVATVGIHLIGCSTGTGFHNVVDFATGIISGNTVRNYGTDSLSGGSITLQDTQGAVVMGNALSNCAGSAIRIDYNNKDAVVVGNTATDCWGETSGVAAMIHAQSGWNTFKATGNVLLRGDKVATSVNLQGLRLGSALATSCVEGNNDFLAAATPYTGANGLIRHDRRGIQDGFVTALPIQGIWQRSAQALTTTAAASASPGWVCVTAGGASSAAWAATTAYTAAAWIRTASGKVLECVKSGTSGGTSPDPTVIGEVVADGTALWVYRSAASAVFKTMPALGA